MPSATVDDALPCITLVDPGLSHTERVLAALGRQDGLGAVASLLAAVRAVRGAGWRSLAKSLIEEGEQFSRTPAGERWSTVLGGSHLVHNGWVMWNQLNADYYVRNAPPLTDDPVTLLHEVLRAMAQADIEALVRQMSGLAMAVDAELHAADRNAATAADDPDPR